jgi:phosphate-selective porin OprO and OprP
MQHTPNKLRRIQIRIMQRKHIHRLVTSIIAAVVSMATAHAQTSDPALNVLVKKGIITEQEAKQAIADLEKAKASTPPTVVPTTPPSVAAPTAPATTAERAKLWGPKDVRFFWKDGLNFESGDGKTFKGKIGGRMQYDIAGFGQDDDVRDLVGDADISTEFRRARLYTSGEINEGAPIYYILQMDFAGSDVRFTDAYLGMRQIPYVGSVQFGQMYEPFSLEQLTSDNYVTLPERAAPIEAFSPARNVGIQVQNALFGERMTYAFGAFADDENDDVDGDAFESNGRITARVTGLPWYDEESGGRRYLHVGLGGSAMDLRDEMVRYRTRPEAHLAPRYVDTGNVPAERAYLGNLEALLTYESFSLQAEYFQTCLDSSGMSGPDFNGFYVMGTWFLTGEHRPYKKSAGVVDRVKPKKNFSLSGSGPGAIELIGRVSQVDLNDGAVRGGRLTDYTAGLGWYLNPNTRFIFNYIYADMDRAGVSGGTHIWQTRFQVDF